MRRVKRPKSLKGSHEVGAKVWTCLFWRKQDSRAFVGRGRRRIWRGVGRGTTGNYHPPGATTRVRKGERGRTEERQGEGRREEKVEGGRRRTKSKVNSSLAEVSSSFFPQIVEQKTDRDSRSRFSDRSVDSEEKIGAGEKGRRGGKRKLWRGGEIEGRPVIDSKNQSVSESTFSIIW